MVDELEVQLDDDDHSGLVGRAWFTQRRGGPVSTVFAYDPSYLATPAAFAIDPDLTLVAGNQYTDGLPGAFQDCSPDRWGRNLIMKRHRASTPEEAGRTGELNDVDYLIGVSDLTRQGALRFTQPGRPIFLDPGTDVPKLVDLPRLVAASDSLADGSDDCTAVKLLLDAGSGSLGGARPKASVRDHGRLMIAKFPHQHDEWDVMGWECVALDLAESGGLAVPPHRLVDLGDRRRVLVVDRFDRTEDWRRIPYISAMTLLSGSDGGWYDYVDVADHLADISAAAGLDLADLYRRVVFSVAIHNTDDHLRNIGLLHEPGGWRLAPVFDVNPNPDRRSLRVTGIAGATERVDEPAGLAQLAARCRLSIQQAEAIRRDVDAAVATWPAVARRYQLSQAEILRFETAFGPTAF